jgi:hypothetical protein
MKTILSLLLLTACSCLGQNFAVKLAQDVPGTDPAMPTNWPVRVQPIGDAAELPEAYAGWRYFTKAQLDQLKADNAEAIALWEQVYTTRESRKERVAQLLQERIEAGQWEPNRLRLHALESELFGKLIQAFRLNSELLLLVTKAVGGTVATNNLTAPERARLTAIRPQLTFGQAEDITQADRDRVLFITTQLQKIESLWKQARALRANIETNTAFVDPNSLPETTIGE